jgi:hypothetical protein
MIDFLGFYYCVRSTENLSSVTRSDSPLRLLLSEKTVIRAFSRFPMRKVLFRNEVPAKIQQSGIEKLRPRVRFALPTKPGKIIKPPRFYLFEERAHVLRGRQMLGVT